LEGEIFNRAIGATVPGKKKASKKEQIQSRDQGPKGGTSEAGKAGEPEMSDEMSALRRQAEEMLLKQPLVLDKMPPADLQSLVHELRVQQIELEMQNDELRRVQHELEESRDKYSDLYNLAPVGHITLTEKGIMLDVTPPAATLMGKERSHLIRQPLTRFIIREDQDIYYHHNKRLFETREYQECELRMLKGDGTQFWAQVKSLVTKGNEGGLASRTAIIDITRLKQAEESLKDSAEQFRNLADSIPNLAWWANGDGYITWYNRRWYEYTGTTPEQMEGLGWQSVHDPEVLSKVIERWKASIATGEPFDMEFPLRGADRKFRLFLTRVLPMKNSAGLVLRWFGTNTDISAISLSMKELRQSEERYRTLFNSMMEGFCIIEVIFDSAGRPVDYRFLEVNTAFEAQTGLKKAQGRLMRDLAPDHEAHWFEIYGKIALTGEPARFVNEARALNRWFNVFAYRFGRPENRQVAIVFQDITERMLADVELRESKEKLSMILNSTAEGIYGLDGFWKCTFCNPAGIKILGYHDEKDLIGKNMHALIHHTKADGTPYPQDECPTGRAVIRGEYIHGDNALLWRSDGTSFPAEFWAYPIFKSNELIGAVVTFLEITERLSLENQLIQAQKMEAVGLLAGGIAHDFNNILSAIVGYGYLLQTKMNSDDPLREHVDQILVSADRAAEVTHSLLAFSRKQILNPKPININALMKRIEKLLFRLIGEDIELSTNLTDKDVISMADAGQIEQVLLNLATNARDAMPNGGHLTLDTQRVELDDTFIRSHGYGEPGMFTVISVSDTGSGMDKETMAKIFEPFFTTKEVEKGTGLGLAMVYGIIKQHNGYINVYSEPGSGTTFRLYLPAIESMEEVLVKTEIEPLPSNGNETILVAEDDAALRRLFSTILQAYGYKVILAQDGEEAIKKFADNRDKIQLIMLDMIMPKKSGKEVFDIIRKMRPDIKTLFSSGYTADRIDKDNMSKGGFDFIMKPVSPKELLKKIREVLDK
jgi:PAS domain S-box-containing protein